MSQINFLDENGLLYLWQRLKTIFATENDLAAIESTVSGLVAAGGQANVIETIQVNGAAQSVTNKTVNIIVPTNNSQLANGAGYQTAAQVTSAIDVTSSPYMERISYSFSSPRLCFTSSWMEITANIPGSPMTGR